MPSAWSGPARRWPKWGWRSASAICPAKCPAASSSAWRSLVNRPPILLADEPTGALDSKTGEEILALFKRLRDADHTIILITHDAEVAAHADRTFVMHDGELHVQGAAP